jgi:hypothetical protein
MKTKLLSSVALALGLWLTGTPAASAASAPATQPAPAPSPGAQVAQTISTVTGVAISPLLGMSAVGVWQWVQAPAEKRASLPWFAQPWFWLPALVLVGVCIAKDTVGTAAPTVLKKPLDVAEAVEHKISGLVAAGAFVPLVAMIFAAAEPDHAALGAAGLAVIDLHPLYNALMVPVALLTFGMVFLASNAINVLILLSPFTTVDAGLKLFRGAVLATVTATAFNQNPWIGAAWSLALILLASLIAGWSFRLSVLGMVSIWDVLTFRQRRFTPDATANWMFLSRKTGKVPTRTFGKLSHDTEGRLVFRYRPWLVLKARRLTLPPGSYAVGHGLIWSELVRVEGEEATSAMILPPRCRTHEAELARVYSLNGVRPIGLRALFRWLFGGGQAKPA